ncbi:DNA glycosylase AlkZ-like family protein [Actinopolymorpha singaporensis]|uniref:Winged helix DNA-binding domain-containing protein n=1 Tax=Actinopolymorpha singaporensis TaxID=117157 RepID=A0A1H1VMZ4_9ACTN|nr:crosslink repair DNA glycosylase YcaQ family protein [Actinopolymorpha singaporensis]SDS86257.1 Winged helix DNA-binding domain-containing protein [Actinopolymorpha singaporensis]
MTAALKVSRVQAVAHRLRAHHLVDRMPAGSYVEAARYGLQDSAPRAALLSLHARVDACEPTAWEAAGLLQTYSPRMAVHVLPAADFGVFTVGRVPDDPALRREVEEAADEACRVLAGEPVRGTRLSRDEGRQVRVGAASGRIAVRWDTRSLTVREIAAPDIDPAVARAELARRHLHAFGPTTPRTFAWWAGMHPHGARQVWRQLAGELLPVDFEGQPAWILAEDEHAVRQAGEVRGVRLLPAEDLGLLGADRAGLFVGPAAHRKATSYDWYHPNGILVDGRLAGQWGRRGGRVEIGLDRALAGAVRDAVAAEALSMPVPGASMRVEFLDR